MDSPFCDPPSTFLDSKRRKSQNYSLFSEYLTSIIPNNRQKGIQTIVFNTFAILLSVAILFLLSQVYLIFLPCLKALLWALLCGSALYPFKVKLNSSLGSWLKTLEDQDRSFCSGLIQLPFNCLFTLYNLLIDFIYQNYILFIIFHFRFQLCDALSVLCGISLTILGHNKGIITTFVIFCSSAQVFLVIFKRSNIFLHVLSSFSFLPSIFLLSFFYFLHCVGIIGHILFTAFICISVIGCVFTFYSFTHDSKKQSEIIEELNNLVNVLNETLKAVFNRFIGAALRRFNLPDDDSPDSVSAKLGTQFISVLLTIFLFVLSEQMQISTVILGISGLHLVTFKMFSKISERTIAVQQVVSERFANLKSSIGAKLEKDIFFQFWIYFFLKGDLMIRKTLQKSSDLLTSLALIFTVSVVIVFFSVFLSIKVYGECYSAIYLLRNELGKIDYIRDSINLTLNDVTNVDYLNNLVRDNLLSTNKLNLKEEDKVMISKMLVDFGENILIFLNASRTNPESDLSKLNHSSSLLTETLGEPATTVDTSHLIRSLFSHFALVDLKKFNFEIVFNFVNSRANSYLPLLKSFISIFYAFIFVILDGGFVVLGFVLNCFIFTLALFYLLSTSRQKYKPIEFLDNIVSSIFTSCEQNRFSRYVEEVVNSIFAATLKISAFYGIYTWLLHSLFDIQICCIPSVIAAILAAVPLLNACWASLPACLYLYYFDQNLPVLKSLTMFIMAIMPSFIVDSSIYSDIKRAGHPYLTGLAITCGVVYFGVEGALFGPLWLCFLFIIIQMISSLTESNQAAYSIASTPT